MYLGAIVDTNSAGLSTPFDDAVQAADHAFGGQREVDLDAQTSTVEVVRLIQQPECPAIAQ